MTDRMPYAEQCTRVYTRTGRVAHLLSSIQTIRNGSALCPVLPEWDDEWRGTGSQREIEHAASLPLCSRCGAAARAEDEYYSEPSQFTPDPAAGGPRRRREDAPAAPPGGYAGTLDPASPPAGSSTDAPPVPAPRSQEETGGARASSRAAQRGHAPRCGTREEAPIQAPAGRVPDLPGGGDGRAPAGSTGYSGEEFRKRARAVLSDQAKEQRRRATRPFPKARKGVQAASGPGMVRRMPPPQTPGDAA